MGRGQEGCPVFLFYPPRLSSVPVPRVLDGGFSGVTTSKRARRVWGLFPGKAHVFGHRLPFVDGRGESLQL